MGLDDQQVVLVVVAEEEHRRHAPMMPLTEPTTPVARNAVTFSARTQLPMRVNWGRRTRYGQAVQVAGVSLE